ncbi:OLC1v1003019C1 [Oldenlandia corymbosa var. corymbosa]|uniref:OLC1v1003019C1 n=1 Tax=Oldenlandia corymbosa var. corymbosa TaxID=529605 RepID=A0AAV1D9R4_OLDCO|nr:OLC1v1003019C1 [Oldenlandia corymbosa var. corymbosa]
MAGDSTEILHDFYPLIRVYKDGRIERFEGLDFVPASVDPETGVQAKDVEISPEFNVSARLYLPDISKFRGRDFQKLPLLVYFHGGAFVVGSTFSSTYQKHLISLAHQARVIIVSVNYRLAPEHPLPAAYEDSRLALKWVASHSTSRSGERWLLDHADFGHVYFGGDSAGGNIAHKMALKIGVEGLDGFKLDGIFLACPYFWGKDPIGNEAERKLEKKFLDKLWPFVCPNSTGGLDDPWINPAKSHHLSRLACKKVLVFVGGEDVLKDRGWYYKESLERSGWNGDVEVVEVEGEGHVFHLTSPNSQKARLMVRKLVSFLQWKMN